ncbi:MAG: DUF5784 family protein [Halobacteriaceae archaeon]
MARPLRFRHSPERWSADRVRRDLYADLDANLGATARRPWYAAPEGYDARRFEMDNGDVALFCWNGTDAYWVGNTETPRALWKTEKYPFADSTVPAAVTEWVERELLAQLHEEAPWLADYPALSWFFLPVFLSKDGRDTSRAFFREHAAGFPDATPGAAMAYYDDFLATCALDGFRYTMASKLGTSEYLDETRMAAAMGEFDAARLLHRAGYDVEPEVEVTTGHSLDFRASRDGEATLVEVTRPLPPADRSAGTPAAAVRDTAATKTDGQLAAHGGGVTLFVDCSSFPGSAWREVMDARPSVGHRPAVVYRVRPDGSVEGYALGSVPLDLGWL